MKKPTVGLLPHYIELYDRTAPQLRAGVEAFLATVAQELRRRGLDVADAPVCRLAGEFRSAVDCFEAAGVCGIVSLHLAYSPSLESIDALVATSLPLMVLDTTPDYRFGPGQDGEAINYNHGIHGVQDLCCMLLRRKRPFAIEAGHWEHSDVLDRVAEWARAAAMAAAFRSQRVGIIGQPFRGMGDFSVTPQQLQEAFGITVVQATAQRLREYADGLEEATIQAEMRQDRQSFAMPACTEEAHRKSVVAGLAVRRWIAEEGLAGITINFMDTGSQSGLPAMPFAEAGKAMAGGIGYAGEGDTLTAALLSAVAQAIPESSFTEMFCPDWAGGTIFLSHMGEMNPTLAAGKPTLVEVDFPYTDHGRAVSLAGRFRPGAATILNLSPGPDGCFRLITAAGEMMDAPEEGPMVGSVRGWFRPQMPIHEFLAAYSRAGGTHHSVLAYGRQGQLLARFAAVMGWDLVEL